MTMTTKMNTEESATSERGGPARLQIVALCFGVLFSAAGIARMIAGLTTHDDALLLSHTVLHLVLGVAGVLASRRLTVSRDYLMVGGAAYGVLWLFVPVAHLDPWLHLGVAAVMISSAGGLWDRCRGAIKGVMARTPEPVRVARGRTEDSRRICAMTWPNYLG
jgi:Domain of unknown function (DUF4383)